MLNTPLIAAIDWPFLVLGLLVVALIVSWPAYGRRIREATLAEARGDHARSADVWHELRNSWLPIALVLRLFARGQSEAMIALHSCLMGLPDEAIAWADRGLRIARSHRFKGLLHLAAAFSHTDRNEPELVERHLAALNVSTVRQPHSEISYPLAACECYISLGRLDKALTVLRGELERGAQPPRRRLLAIVLLLLRLLGRFEDTMRLAARHCDEAGGGEPAIPPSSSSDASLGIDLARKALGRRTEVEILARALEAAERAEAWDVAESYLRFMESQGIADPSQRLDQMGFSARLAAHRGDREQSLSHIQSMEHLVAQFPRLRRLRATFCEQAARAYQLLGDHQAALDVVAGAPEPVFPPICASALHAEAAEALEATGRVDEARPHREEALRLAPLACWNRPQATGDSPPFWQDDVDAVIALIGTPVSETPASETLIAPVAQPADSVASPAASWVWVMSVLAFFPLLGSIPGVVLGVLGVHLLAKRKPRAHDRRVGWTGVTLACLSIGFATAGLHNLVTLYGGDDAASNLPEDYEFADPLHETENGVLIEEDEEESAAAYEVEEGPSEHRVSWPTGVLYLAVLIASVILHEVGHAVAALWAGDPTARDQGRITLNPLKHLTWFGSLILPVVLLVLPGDSVLGWAKPVPMQPQRFRHRRRGNLGAALAGVSMNLLIALIATNLLAIVLIVLSRAYPDVWLSGLAVPLAPPLVEDAPWPWAWSGLIEFCKAAVLVNALLACFNLLPFPPLDGFAVIRAIVPRRLGDRLLRWSPAGIVIFLLLIAFGKVAIILIPGAILAGILLGSALILGGWYF